MPEYLHNHTQFSDLLNILSEEKGIQPGLIEKDYWLMHALYGLKKQGFDFEQKGGTSLSKGYKIIDRFSEDIDIHIKPPFRFSDYSTLSRHQLKEGMLHVRQSKTGATVVVPLREDARKILIDKYSMRMPKVSMVNFNYYIKEVVRLASIDEPVKITHKRGSRVIEETRPKYAWISSHTARRSFCTNEYLSGTPGDLMMAISGHKTEVAFKKYIKADRIKKASMIKVLWDHQPGL